MFFKQFSNIFFKISKEALFPSTPRTAYDIALDENLSKITHDVNIIKKIWSKSNQLEFPYAYLLSGI